jgi:hypothetical protein
VAFTEDVTTHDYLRQHPVIVIPFANPDGFPSSRNNANGADLNRGWLSYSEPENRAIAVALTDYTPQVVLDLHENGTFSEQFTFAQTERGEASAAIRALCADLQVALKDSIGGEGYSTGDYNSSDLANYLMGSSSFRNTVTVLVEAIGQNNNDELLSPKDATNGMRVACETALKWHSSKSLEVRSAVANGLYQALIEGESQSGVVYPSIPSPPLGYVLTITQASQVSESLAALGIRSYQIDGSTDTYVPMAQGSKRLIPQLLDSASGVSVVSAQGVSVAPTIASASVVPLTNVYVREAGAVNLSLSNMALETESLRLVALKQNAPYEWRAQSQEVGKISSLSSWEPFSTTDVSTFDIQWRLLGDSGNETLITDISETSYLLESLTPGMDYEFRGKEYKSSASSAWSAWTGFTTAAAATEVPQGIWTIGTVTKGQTTASLTPSYSGSDAESFQYSINSGAWITFTGTISLSALDADTTYSGAVRATNATGSGASELFAFTTEAVPVVPGGVTVEREYSVDAGLAGLPKTQSFVFYQGDRVKITIVHEFDLSDKVLRYRQAEKVGLPARLKLDFADDIIVLTTEATELMTASAKVWQVILRQGESTVVVAEGTVTVKPRIKDE